MVYDDLQQSEAWRALPHYARTVYTAIAAQYRGSNNGDLDLPNRKAALYGIDHKELSAARFLLESVGLIEITRQGRVEGGKGICTLYALTCLPIDPSDKYDAKQVAKRPPPNTWARWKPPDDWDEFIRRVWNRAQGRKINSLSARGEQAIPHVGSDSGHLQSAREDRRRLFFNPHGEDTFLDSGRGVQQVERMVRDYPHMSDVDIAVAFKWEINQIQVARIRQRIINESKEPKRSDTVLARQISETG